MEVCSGSPASVGDMPRGKCHALIRGFLAGIADGPDSQVGGCGLNMANGQLLVVSPPQDRE